MITIVREFPGNFSKIQFIDELSTVVTSGMIP